MLTAAIAATTSSAAVAQAQAPDPSKLPDDPTLLSVPSGPVANSSIPISLTIPATTFAKDGVVPTAIQVELTISDVSDTPADHRVLTAVLGDWALPVFNTNQASTPAIKLMTRLKMDIDKKTTNQSPQTTVTANVTTSYAGGPKTVKALQKITIKNEDCASSDVAVMRLSLQPPAVASNSGVMVRAIVPPVATVGQSVASTNSSSSPASSPSPAASTAPPPSAPSSSSTTATPSPSPSPSPTKVQVPTHKLTEIVCTKDSDGAKAIDLTIADDSYLSSEVFVGFTIFPRDKSQKMNMGWTYAPSTAITGSTFSAYTLNASGLAILSPPSS
jgi:hypothetical protein